MKILKRWLVTGGIATVLCLGAANTRAQEDAPRPKFDMAQIQKMMLDNMRPLFEVKDDDEWKVIGDQVAKVFDAATKARVSNGAGMARLFRRPGQDGQDGGGTSKATRRGGASFGGPDPDAEALQKAIDSNASNAELKAAVARFQAARKEKQMRLEKEQAALREMLSVRQEAIATSLGLL
jgi:hypothetical protein